MNEKKNKLSAHDSMAHEWKQFRKIFPPSIFETKIY